MKKSFVLSGLILTAITVVLFLWLNSYIYNEKQAPNPEVEIPNTPVVVEEEIEKPTLPNVSAGNTFSGTLEEVNVGCFVDGECFVVVDGKHVTVLRGWSQEIVGSVKGVESFGDLEGFVGEKVEVSARKLEDGTYTLYGKETFYLKLLNSGGATGHLGETTNLLGIKITPLQVLEDSRCPIDVQCIQAGTLRLRANLETASGVSEQVFLLGESITTEAAMVKMFAVEPITDSKTKIAESEYTFYFQVKLK